MLYHEGTLFWGRKEVGGFTPIIRARATRLCCLGSLTVSVQFRWWEEWRTADGHHLRALSVALHYDSMRKEEGWEPHEAVAVPTSVDTDTAACPIKGAQWKGSTAGLLRREGTFSCGRDVGVLMDKADLWGVLLSFQGLDTLQNV